jgi:hypothetical protein
VWACGPSVDGSFLFFLFYLSHILACGWYLVMVLEDNTECILFTTYLEAQECCYNWWTCHGPENIFSTVQPAHANARKYFLSFFWALGAMLTVGSNVTAATDAERAYEMVVNVIAGLVYAYLIGAMAHPLSLPPTARGRIPLHPAQPSASASEQQAPEMEFQCNANCILFPFRALAAHF